MKKAGDTITINKPGNLLHGITTEIVSINPESARPVKINHYGDWLLTWDEVGVNKPNGEVRVNKPVDKPNSTVEATKTKSSVTRPKTTKVATASLKAAKNKGVTKITETGSENKIENLKVATKPKGKAGRKPKVKNEPDKPKRKYTRKEKQ